MSKLKFNLFKMSTILFIFVFLFFMIPSIHALIENSSMKIFAVNSSDTGMEAVLDIRVTPGTGKIYSSLDSIVGNSTQKSEKNAVNVAELKVKNSKNKYDYFFDIESNAYSVDGPSAGGAMALSIISMLKDINLSQEVSMTGTISSEGNIGNVGGIYNKSKKAAEVGIKLFMIPVGNRKQMIKDDDGEVKLVDIVSFFYNKYNMKIVEVSTIDDVLLYAYKDINSIDVNAIEVQKKPEFIPKKINYSLGLDPMNKLVDNYIVDANNQLNNLEKSITESSIKDTSILQNMLSVINYSKTLYNKAEIFAETGYLYSSANNSFLVLVNTNTVNEIITNPSILSDESAVFDMRLEDLKNKIDLIENRSSLCSLEKIDWCIAAKQRITWSRNKLEDLYKDYNKNVNNNQDAVSRITDYSYALEWANIANDFLDIGITNSDVKFVESDYFKELAQQQIVDIENKLVISNSSYSKSEDVLRRLNAAKADVSKGWYTTALFDATTCMATLVSKTENDKELFDTNNFESRYNKLLDELRSVNSLNKNNHIWSKLYFDHAVYFYKNYKFYLDIDKQKSNSNLKISNSVINIASYLFDMENKVLDYYNNVDMEVIITTNNISSDNELNTYQNQNTSSKNIYIVNKQKTSNLYLYISLLFLVILILIIIEFEKFKKVDSKERIKKQISDIDEKLLEGRISPFTHKELRHRYLEDLRRIKLLDIQKSKKYNLSKSHLTNLKLKKNIERELLERHIQELQLRHKELVQSEGGLKRVKSKVRKKRKKRKVTKK